VDENLGFFWFRRFLFSTMTRLVQAQLPWTFMPQPNQQRGPATFLALLSRRLQKSPLRQRKRRLAGASKVIIAANESFSAGFGVLNQ
jgi:hypothetical protein